MRFLNLPWQRTSPPDFKPRHGLFQWRAKSLKEGAETYETSKDQKKIAPHASAPNNTTSNTSSTCTMCLPFVMWNCHLSIWHLKIRNSPRTVQVHFTSKHLSLWTWHTHSKTRSGAQQHCTQLLPLLEFVWKLEVHPEKLTPWTPTKWRWMVQMNTLLEWKNTYHLHFPLLPSTFQIVQASLRECCFICFISWKSILYTSNHSSHGWKFDLE